jgi:hypothetical protein
MKNSILTLSFIMTLFSAVAQNNSPKLTLDHLHHLNKDIEKICDGRLCFYKR